MIWARIALFFGVILLFLIFGGALVFLAEVRIKFLLRFLRVRPFA
jgi:hypothetical protein